MHALSGPLKRRGQIRASQATRRPTKGTQHTRTREMSTPRRPGLQGECDFSQKLGQVAFCKKPPGGLCPPCKGARTTFKQHRHPVGCCHSKAIPLWQVSICLFAGFLVTALGKFQRKPQIRAGLRSAPKLHLPLVQLPLAAVPVTDCGHFLAETSAFTFIPDTPELDKRPMSGSRRNTQVHHVKGRHQRPLQTLPLQSHTISTLVSPPQMRETRPEVACTSQGRKQLSERGEQVQRAIMHQEFQGVHMSIINCLQESVSVSLKKWKFKNNLKMYFHEKTSNSMCMPRQLAAGPASCYAMHKSIMVRGWRHQRHQNI